MIEIERHLGSGDGALLMAYCASLAYFEGEVYEPLHRAGAARVIVLLDWREHENSFSEVLALHSMGVDYRAQPVRLPNPQARFHPKLYLTRGPAGATLLVASANLTLSGFRRNAEVVDRLTLAPGGAGGAAFRAYAELLDSLPDLDPRLPADICAALAEDATALRALAGPVRRGADSGPWLLHTVTYPLIDQVVARIPPAAVDEIVAISPFFDPGCLALRELAARYPRARLRVIKAGPQSGGRPDDFAGATVRSLSRRLSVEELESVAGEAGRRLHAKVVAFRGPGGAWLLTGSANLTAPAWLRAARGGPDGAPGGNLEACVLRAVDSSDIDRILAPLACTPVAHARLQYVHPAETDAAAAHYRLGVLDAEADAAVLTVRVDSGDWSDAHASMHVGVEARGARSEFRDCRRTTVRGVVTLTASLEGHPLAEDDAPAIVTVDMVLADGTMARGRTWLVRPALLALSSEARARRRAVAQMAQRLFVSGEDYEIVADAVAALVTEVGDLLAERGVPAAPAGAGATGPPAPPRPAGAPISLDDYVTITDEDIAAYHATGHRPQAVPSLLRQLVGAVERLFSAGDADAGEDGAPPDHGEVRAAVTGAGAAAVGAESDEAPTDKFTVPALKEALVRRVAGQAQAVAAKALAAPMRPEAAEYVVRILTTVTGVLLRLHIQAALRDNPAAAAVLAALRETFASAFSLDGTLLGSPRGWLIRAWADPDVRPALTAALADPVRSARLATMLAAAVVRASANGPVPSSGPPAAPGGSFAPVTAGLDLVRGQAGPAPEQYEAAAADQATRLAAQTQGLVPLEALLAALVPVEAASLPVVAAATRWECLLALLHANGDAAATAVASAALAASDPGLLAAYCRSPRTPAAVAMRRGPSGAYCTGCNTRLPTATAATAERATSGATSCDTCHRVLIPFAANSPVTLAVLAALVPRPATPSLATRRAGTGRRDA